MTPGSPSWNYEKLTWCEKLERTPSDFGEPTKTNPEDWDKFEDVERNPDYMLAAKFF